MAWPLVTIPSTRRDHIVAVVLGTRTTQAVWLKRDGEQLHLLNTLLQDAPGYDKGFTRDLLAGHLAEIKKNLGATTNHLILVAGMADAILRPAELPIVEPSVMRKMVRIHSKNYFQQSLPDFSFDCFVWPQKEPIPAASGENKRNKKSSVLVGAAKEQFVNDLFSAAEDAGFEPISITLSQVSLINAACFDFPTDFAQQSIAILDIGFLTSTISILVNGELLLTRVVGIGADKLTTGVAEAMKITYPVAESLKSVMPEKIQALLQSLIAPLGEELRTAIHFSESQQDKHITQVLVCGGSARSAVLLEILQRQLEIPCILWTPLNFLQLRASPERDQQIQKDLPQLAAAIGAAASVLKPPFIELNLLADRFEQAERYRRDPFRRGLWAAAALVLIMLTWVAWLALDQANAGAELRRREAELKQLQRLSIEAVTLSKRAGEIETTLQSFERIATNRFVWTLPLDALQRSMVPEIRAVRLRMEQILTFQPAVKSITKPNGVVIPAKPAITTEKIILTIQGKDSGNPPAVDLFIDTLSNEKYFQHHLQKQEPVRLTERLAPQVDPLDPKRTFTMFTIECVFPERQL